jgi:hypothetical protein
MKTAGGCVAPQSRIDLDMLLPSASPARTAWPAAHFDRNATTPGHKTMARLGELMERSRANGPLRNASMAFVAAMMTSLAEATMDFMIQDTTDAKKHCKAGFDALWRVIG